MFAVGLLYTFEQLEFLVGFLCAFYIYQERSVYGELGAQGDGPETNSRGAVVASPLRSDIVSTCEIRYRFWFAPANLQGYWRLFP